MRCSAKIFLTLVICAGTAYLMINYQIENKRNKIRHVPFQPLSQMIVDDAIRDMPTGREIMDNWVLVEQEMQARKELLEIGCNKVYNNATHSIHSLNVKNIIVNDKLKILYCKIPKVACSNWMKVFYIASYPFNFSLFDQIDLEPMHMHKQSLKKYFPTLNMYSKQEIEYRIQNYLKFIFVRHPFERILSAYLDKFIHAENPYFRLHFGTKIYQLINESVSLDDFHSGEHITFKQFVKYLVHSKVKRPFNEHWQQFSEICHPCSIEYDIIGKFDTMDTDIQYTLKRMGIEDRMQWFTRGRYKNSTTKEQRSDAYKIIPEEHLEKLKVLYDTDFKLFGYNSSSW